MVCTKTHTILLVIFFLLKTDASTTTETAVDCKNATKELCWDIQDFKAMLACTEKALSACEPPLLLFHKLGPDIDCQDAEQEETRLLCYRNRCIRVKYTIPVRICT